MLKESMVHIDSKSLVFKKKVLDYGKMNVGKAVTFKTFEAWLNKQEYYLVSTDMYWKAVFTSILKHNYILDYSYRKDENQQIITTFIIEY